MSRTIRRKNYDAENQKNSWCRQFNRKIGPGATLEIRYENGRRIEEWRDETKWERRGRILREHGDNQPGHHNAPKEFRQTLERQYRRQCEQAIIRGLKDEAMDAVIPDGPKDVNWEWF